MSDEQDKLRLSLEPPRLFGRKKKSGSGQSSGTDQPAEASTPPAPPRTPKKRPAARPEPASPAPDAEVTEDEPAAPARPTAGESPAAAEETMVLQPEPADEPEPEQTEQAQKPVPQAAESDTVVIEEPTDGAADETADASAGTGAAATTSPEVRTVEPAAEPAGGRTAAGEQAGPAEEPRRAPGGGLAARLQRPAAAAKQAARGLTRAPRPAPSAEPVLLDRAEREDAEIAARLADEGPLLQPYPAAAVTGAVVGGAMVLLTWLALRGCEAVRGTATCGGGPGFLLLVATFVVCVLLGSALLETFTVPDPGSTSFLAVGLVAVVALLFLIEVLDSWVTVIVVPLLAVGAYLVSTWVTTTFVEPGEST